MKKDLIKIILSGILYLFAIIVPFSNIWITRSIYIISYLIVATEILEKALKNILKGEILGENFLMSIATIGAFAIGEFPEAVAVILFYQVGELFQDYATDKSRKSIIDLMDIRPDYANLIKDEKEEKVNPKEVEIGDIILVKPGEKIPLDGTVIEGNSMLDTKALTGESVPRKVEIGEEILSGCINQNGLLKVKVTKEFENSTVNKILELVENANNRKSKSEKFITKFAEVYTPTVVIIAIILAFVPPIIIKNAEFTTWIYRALSFLVVSCPCALVLSIPLGFFGGIGKASKHGILIKGSNYLEDLSKAETVVFDKTGTLTKGVFDVQKVVSNEVSQKELIEIAAIAEKYSNHPIAQSLKKAYGKEIQVSVNTKEISGQGLCSNFDGKEVLIGNEKLMMQNNINFQKCTDVGTVLYVTLDKKFIGYILISDQVKEDSINVIKELKANGVENTIMLTGDRKEIAEDVAKKLNIDKTYAELLPEGKVKKVEELLEQKNEKSKLIFVGDGINDAPALALADIGVAMGGLGSDSAIEAADIVIMTDEPSKLNTAIKISRKTMQIVKENIVFAISVKIAILILSALGLTNMWWAVFADVGVSVIAVINSLRMLSNNI